MSAGKILFGTTLRQEKYGFDEFKYACRINCNAGLWETQVEWLAENIGEVGDRWDYYYGRFWFVDERDLLYFKLVCE